MVRIKLRIFRFFFFFLIICNVLLDKTKLKKDNLPYKQPTRQGADYQAKTQKQAWKAKKN